MATMISCEGVSKHFRIPVSEHSTARGRLLHPFSPRHVREFQALDDISFEIEEGEFFGIVGRNGSGKSTLLKILAGIYGADSGSVRVAGSLAPFIELGVGFNFELSGRDNVFLNGALLGLSNRQLKERYDHIVRFAELEEFMELKLANFSSGMQVRLAFAIAVESDADILLIDEVLAVGDERFQRKCFEVFEARKRAGKTVVFVSHDMGSVMEFCDRALLLEHGRQVELGNSEDVADSYLRLNLPVQADWDVHFGRGWIGEISLHPFSVVDERIAIVTGETVTASVQVTAMRDLAAPRVGFVIADVRGNQRFVTNTAFTDQVLDPIAAGSIIEAKFRFDTVLAPGSYLISVTLEDGVGQEPVDITRPLEFTVRSPNPTGAPIEVPHNISVRVVGQAGAAPMIPNHSGER